jgi:hypothetical protein
MRVPKNTSKKVPRTHIFDWLLPGWDRFIASSVEPDSPSEFQVRLAVPLPEVRCTAAEHNYSNATVIPRQAGAVVQMFYRTSVFQRFPLPSSTAAHRGYFIPPDQRVETRERERGCTAVPATVIPQCRPPPPLHPVAEAWSKLPPYNVRNA